jgi:hypothetical protein
MMCGSAEVTFRKNFEVDGCGVSLGVFFSFSLQSREKNCLGLLE